MQSDLDLIRVVALTLESLQRSPPEPIILGLSAFAQRLDCTKPAMENALERLMDLQLIEGPGRLSDNWIFRRMTNKGTVFVDEIRTERRWREISRLYSQNHMN